MKRNMNLKATAGILLAQATMLGAVASTDCYCTCRRGRCKAVYCSNCSLD